MTKTTEEVSFKNESIPEEIKILMIDLIRHCPFCFGKITDLRNPPIKLKKDVDGWFFSCQVCNESQCSGYIKNNPR